jgi:predicted dehydrogenase
MHIADIICSALTLMRDRRYVVCIKSAWHRRANASTNVMLRAAIVGLGWWGKNLVASVQGKSRDIEFVAGHTRSPAKAAEFCHDNAISLADDFDAILADPAIDAVVLATPPSQHGEQARRTVAAGKHIFVEKPFSLTAADAKATIEAAQQAGVVLAAGFNRRFHPSMAALRECVRNGRLGVIEGCVVEQTAGGGVNMRPDEWRANPQETPAGAMTGIGIHIVDGMIDLFGTISEVRCIATRRVAPLADDTTAVLVKFREGMSGVFFCSFVTVPNYRFAVYGTNGVAEVLKPTQDEFRFAPLTDPKSGHLASLQPETTITPNFDTLKAELEAFAAAIRENKPYPVSLDEILHGVNVFEAIAKSARTGQAVAIR